MSTPSGSSDRISLLDVVADHPTPPGRGPRSASARTDAVAEQRSAGHRDQVDGRPSPARRPRRSPPGPAPASRPRPGSPFHRGASATVPVPSPGGASVTSDAERRRRPTYARAPGPAPPGCRASPAGRRRSRRALAARAVRGRHARRPAHRGARPPWPTKRCPAPSSSRGRSNVASGPSSWSHPPSSRSVDVDVERDVAHQGDDLGVRPHPVRVGRPGSARSLGVSASRWA